jgi:thiosulfate/3-mercaptopyruvate sulfurtransferase
MDALVSTSWLAARLGHTDLRVLDCTVLLTPQAPGGYAVGSGRAAWEKAQLPNSAFADLAADLSDPHSPLRFTSPPPERFAEAIGALGVGDRNRVVQDEGVSGGGDAAAVRDDTLAAADHVGERGVQPLQRPVAVGGDVN